MAWYSAQVLGAANLQQTVILTGAMIPYEIDNSDALFNLGFACGVVGAVPSVMVGLFPARVRVSGISFTYNIAYALWASTTPLLLIALMPTSPWICVGYCVVMGAVGVGSVALFGKRHTLAS